MKWYHLSGGRTTRRPSGQGKLSERDRWKDVWSAADSGWQSLLPAWSEFSCQDCKAGCLKGERWCIPDCHHWGSLQGSSGKNLESWHLCSKKISLSHRWDTLCLLGLLLLQEVGRGFFQAMVARTNTLPSILVTSKSLFNLLKEGIFFFFLIQLEQLQDNNHITSLEKHYILNCFIKSSIQTLLTCYKTTLVVFVPDVKQAGVMMGSTQLWAGQKNKVRDIVPTCICLRNLSEAWRTLTAVKTGHGS